LRASRKGTIPHWGRGEEKKKRGGRTEVDLDFTGPKGARVKRLQIRQRLPQGCSESEGVPAQTIKRKQGHRILQDEGRRWGKERGTARQEGNRDAPESKGRRGQRFEVQKEKEKGGGSRKQFRTDPF